MKPLQWYIGVGFALSFVSCTPDIDTETPTPGSADFTNVIAIGGNFLTGYQDGALTPRGQSHSIPALLSRQLSEAGGKPLEQNLVNGDLGWNLKPWESRFVNASVMGWRTDCEGVVSLGPVKDSLSQLAAQLRYANSFLQNNRDLTVPFATTSNLLDPSFGIAPSGNSNPYYHRIASAPGTSTVLGDANSLAPTFFTAWLGMEEIFAFARNGGAGVTIPSAAQFSAQLDSLLGPLTANGAKGVIANIPDFRSFPYYTLIPWNGAELTQSKADSLNDIYEVSGLTHIVFQEGNNGFVIGDAGAPSGVRQITREEYITLSVPLDSMKCYFMGILFTVIPDRYVLDSSEVSEIDNAILSYNAVIAQKAEQYNLALVDAHQYFATVQQGVMWDGVEYNAEFVSGGFFSLDGYHPHEKGYALLTNEFIYAINRKYGATIPTLNCTDCNGVLFP